MCVVVLPCRATAATKAVLGIGYMTLTTMEDSGFQESKLAAAHSAVPSSWLIRGAGEACVSLVARRELGAC
jgi:hypothetical protein